MSLVNAFWNKVQKMDQARIAQQTPTPGVKEIADIAYLEDGNKYHLLNVCYPEAMEGQAKKPTIIDIHGGGWYYGDKDLNKYYCFDIAARGGYAVVAPSYRLTPEADYVEQIRDVFAVFNWVEANAEKYGFDLDDLYITGDSAGGHLSGIATNVLMNEELQTLFGVSSTLRFKAIGYTCTMFNVTQLCKKYPAGIYFKKVIGKGYKKSPYFPYADVTYSLPDPMIPCFFITCYGDFLKKQNLDHFEIYKQKGVDCELFYADKAEGDYKLEHVFNISYPERPESIAANQAMLDFFKSKR